MKNLLLSSLLFFPLCLVASGSPFKESTLSGTITDAGTKKLLPGVSITIYYTKFSSNVLWPSSTTSKISSDENGNYSVNVWGTIDSLELSLPWYYPKVQKVKSLQRFLNIELEPDFFYGATHSEIFYGKLVDEQGNPVNKAEIQLSDGALLQKIASNSFSFSHILLMKNVTIVSEGYEKKEVDISYNPLFPTSVFNPHKITLIRLKPNSSNTLLSSPKSQPVMPKIWAVVIGVEKYKNPSINLNYSKNDAYEFSSILTSVEGARLPRSQVLQLIDDKATKAGIMNGLEEQFKKAQANDMVIFYFSGHGRPGYFCPYDAGEDEITLISQFEVRKIFEECKAKNKLFIADACYSGNFAEAKPDQSIEKTLEIFNNNLLKSKGGLALLTSSKGMETSAEFSGKQQGLFSYYMCEGLRGAADMNSDNIITLKELFDYVLPKTLKGSQYQQKPVLGGIYDPNMPIVPINKQ